MPAPKFRLFGGPNGSGKTSLFRTFKDEGIIHTEIYVSADRIEADLHKTRKFWFSAYRVKVDNKSFREHILQSGLYQEKIHDQTFIDHIVIKSGVLHIGKAVQINSYHASFIASYLVEALFETGQSFAFETVMSHESKIALLEQAKTFGYKTYLYFIFTDTLSTNVARVQLRVLGGGHAVKEETIRGRAPRTFDLLPAAFALADSAYVIDNSKALGEAATVLVKEGSSIIRADKFPAIIKPIIRKILKSVPDHYFIKKDN